MGQITINHSLLVAEEGKTSSLAQTANGRALLGAEEGKTSSVGQTAISQALLVGQDPEGVFVGSCPQTREPGHRHTLNEDAALRANI